MKKFFLTLILAAFCGMSSAFAYKFSDVCATGQTLYYNITDASAHEVELTHPTNSQINPWSGYTKPSGPIELPEMVEYDGHIYTVTSIGSYTFCECSELTGDLIIPNSVTSIGDHAFASCSGFTGNLVLPNSLTSIGEDAFSSCSRFTGDLVIPDSVTSLGEAAFISCNGFNGSLTLSNSLTSIEDFAFDRCSGLTGNLAIPNSVTSIGFSAFEYCGGLKGDLVIPDSVTEIGPNAFSGCSGFNGNLTIGKSVSLINLGAFSGCISLKGNLVIPNTVTIIGPEAFANCRSFTGDLIIPDSVTLIGEYAFYACSGFTGKLVIPKSLTSIYDYTFYDCSGLTGNLVIPDPVIRIGDFAFYRCKGLTGDLIIPNSVNSIGDYAFQACSGFTGDMVISNSVKAIGRQAFGACYGLTGKLVIGHSLTTIKEWAFDGCDNITSLIYNAKNCTNTYYCFSYLSSVKTITIGSDVRSLPQHAFNNCSFVQSIISERDAPPRADSIAFQGIPTTIPVYIPCGSKQNYVEAQGWKQFTNYRQMPYYEFSANSENEAFGSVTIIQQPDCETDAIVEATANEGCSFKGWSVNGEIISTENPFTFAVTEDTELVAIFSGLGVDDNEMTTASVYPNPTTGLFIIKGQGITKTEVYNAQGQLIRTQMISGDRAEIDLSNAASGLYLVRVTGKKGTADETIIIRN